LSLSHDDHVRAPVDCCSASLVPAWFYVYLSSLVRFCEGSVSSNRSALGAYRSPPLRCAAIYVATRVMLSVCHSLNTTSIKFVCVPRHCQPKAIKGSSGGSPRGEAPRQRPPKAPEGIRSVLQRVVWIYFAPFHLSCSDAHSFGPVFLFPVPWVLYG